MKLIEVVKAYNVINNLKGEQMPLDVSWALVQTINMLQPKYEFFIEKQKEAVEKYPHETTEGKLKFNNSEDSDACIKELNELAEFDVEINFEEKPKIKITDKVNIPVESVIVLKQFIDFVQ